MTQNRAHPTFSAHIICRPSKRKKMRKHSACVFVFSPSWPEIGIERESILEKRSLLENHSAQENLFFSAPSIFFPIAHKREVRAFVCLHMCIIHVYGIWSANGKFRSFFSALQTYKVLLGGKTDRFSPWTRKMPKKGNATKSQRKRRKSHHSRGFFLNFFCSFVAYSFLVGFVRAGY